ncbi:MAG: CheF family chemotaxis protein [Haloarculaceae archaeon]
MSDGEQKLLDTRGQFVQVVEDGRKRNDIEWISGRILLSNKRIVLVSNEGKQTVPLGKLTGVKASQMNQPLAQVEGYLTLQFGANVMLVAPSEREEFRTELYRVLLDQIVVLVKHPALKGGVVQDTNWEKARLKFEEESLGLAITTGQFVELELDDVGTVEQNEKAVMGEERLVIEVEHTIEGTSVETHLSGNRRHMSILEGLARQGEQKNTTDVDLTQEETEVLMALYSGVSPFEIPDFVGMDIEEVEDIYDRLIEAGILEKVRTRREVSLMARGRNIASESMSEQ